MEPTGGAGLKIPAAGEFDLLSLGALVHRLDPGVIPLRKATRCDWPDAHSTKGIEKHIEGLKVMFTFAPVEGIDGGSMSMLAARLG